MSKCNYYQFLGIETNAEFTELRKAYRSRAMECHPDRFGGDPKKAEEFKLLVEAFNVLSDPLSRRNYDMSLGIVEETIPSAAFEKGYYPEDSGAILDTLADDILEELVVGNVVPEDASLQTLMKDLERTEQFCLFREAKTNLYNGSTIVAQQLFRRYLQAAPANILAHYFLSRCLSANRLIKEAERELRVAISLGERRQPPLRLLRIRNELAVVGTRRKGLTGMLRRLFGFSEKWGRETTPAESERASLNRAINRLAAERMRSSKKRIRGELPARTR